MTWTDADDVAVQQWAVWLDASDRLADWVAAHAQVAEEDLPEVWEPGGLPDGWRHVAGLHRGDRNSIEAHLVRTSLGWSVVGRVRPYHELGDSRRSPALAVPSFGHLIGALFAAPAQPAPANLALLDSVAQIVHDVLAEHAANPTVAWRSFRFAKQIPAFLYRFDFPEQMPARLAERIADNPFALCD